RAPRNRPPPRSAGSMPFLEKNRRRKRSSPICCSVRRRVIFHQPTSRESPLLQQLRQLLLSSGYCESGIAPTIDNRDLTLPAADDLPTPLNTLLRLFFMFEDVAPADVSSAIAPLTVDQLSAAGILAPQNDMVTSALRIQPYQNLLFAFPAPEKDVPPGEA